ncbi:beta-ketoacyl-ACP synthase III [Streptomyces sp. NEAU-W12]|uniref:beta-ketoacyl-ACP synthase III n=1 Tax=Streptomyces sp. NEAU-W12 TaxID=2994668 RepID=UPI00224AE222|nr:beta-ketoacyl-ACP synthase III [Streptomyces sp. NEAU-W12]MCX2923444.1 ketoacyl-ACP synthase III [Streptomyces sp. NEAU-W12]
MTGRAAAPAAVIAGIGRYLPPDVVTNDDLAARLDTSDEWIRSRTGIASRRVIAPGVTTSDLAVEAGRRALASAGGGDAEAVVLATTTPDQPCPATAPLVADRLGLGGVAAFDVSSVCSGFLYGLATAAGLIASGTTENVLLIAADAFTTIIDPADRSTAVIFADGAGAVLLRSGRPNEPGAVGRVVLGSDGSLGGLIEVPAGGARQRSSGVAAEPGEEFFRMRGRETFRHAVGRMTESSRTALAAAGWDGPLAADRFAAHQANGRILTAVAEELGIPPERRLSNIERTGNTGAASLAVLLAEATARGELAAGHKTLLTAFGGGLAWGATALLWPELKTVDD